jgi:hypothetical protein
MNSNLMNSTAMTGTARAAGANEYVVDLSTAEEQRSFELLTMVAAMATIASMALPRSARTARPASTAA